MNGEIDDDPMSGIPSSKTFDSQEILVSEQVLSPIAMARASGLGPPIEINGHVVDYQSPALLGSSGYDHTINQDKMPIQPSIELLTSTYEDTDQQSPSRKEQQAGSQVDSYLADLDTEEHDTPLPFISELPTGFCYDVRMRYHCELEPPKNRRDYHPEDPRRIFSIYRELCMAGMIDDKLLSHSIGAVPLIARPLQQIEVREVLECEVELVHDLQHWRYMQSTPYQTADDLIQESYALDSVYLNGVTFDCAKLSAGGAIETARAVASGLVKNAIAIIRPPGHHAECNRPMGFCIFDNVSIAAKVCMADYPDTCKRVMILDWDVHHGNGIQQAFYSDPNVLYVSIHVHEDGEFYPPGPGGNHLHCGANEGEGKTINVPWPTKGMGDADYMYAFQRVIMPIAHEFDPDLVMIAAGFDAADGDQLGGCFVSPACYAQMTHLLKSLANGKVVVCLEGGYNLRSIARSALAVTRTLNGETPPRLEDKTPTASGASTVEKVVVQQSRYWKNLHPRKSLHEEIDEFESERMHDVIRYYQAAQMKEQFDMININVYRDKLSTFFENQVMATSNFESNVPLLVIMHDPPDVIAPPNHASRKLEPHDTWLADGCKYFVHWAIGNGLAVLDVNIPRYLSRTEDDDEEDSSESEARSTAINSIAAYLWDNYIEPNDHPNIFFMGLGTAYAGIMHLLNSRETFHTTITGLINFIPSSLPPPDSSLSIFSVALHRTTSSSSTTTYYPLIPASDQTVFHLSKWYRANSLNVVGNNHYIYTRWTRDSTKKPSKRFGNLVRSERDSLQGLLDAHRDEVTAWIKASMDLNMAE